MSYMDTYNGEKTLSAEQRSELAYDLQGTLKHRKSGIMAIWAYMNGGKEPLERLFREPNYHGEKEKKYIVELARKLANSESFPKHNISLLDLGHGMAADKAISFIEEFNKVANAAADEPGDKPTNRFVEAIGIDVAPGYSDDFKEKMSSYFNTLADTYGEQPASVRTVTKDYTDIEQPLEVEGEAVMVSFNTPIWNTPLNIEDMNPNDLLPKALKFAGRIVGENGYIVTNHYLSTPDDDDLYASKDCEEAVKAILKLIEHEIEPVCISMDPENEGERIPFSECFDYDTSFDTATNTRRMDVISKGNFKVQTGDLFFKTIDKGERFCMVSAAKLGQKEFKQHVANAGCFETPKPDQRIAMREENDDIFGYGTAIKVERRPEF